MLEKVDEWIFEVMHDESEEKFRVLLRCNRGVWYRDNKGTLEYVPRGTGEVKELERQYQETKRNESS